MLLRADNRSSHSREVNRRGKVIEKIKRAKSSLGRGRELGVVLPSHRWDCAGPPEGSNDAKYAIAGQSLADAGPESYQLRMNKLRCQWQSALNWITPHIPSHIECLDNPSMTHR